MAATFQSRTWKAAAISSYFGIVLGALLVTAVIPLTFVCMGETSIEDIADHSTSMRTLSYWFVGMGGITCLTSTLALVSAFVESRIFRIINTCTIGINVLLAAGLLVLGLVSGDAGKNYLEDVWNEMGTSTKQAIQRHYSCCGFLSSPPKGSFSSCYANEEKGVYWPDGCYDRVISFLVPASSVEIDGEIVTMGTNTFNVFLLGFVLPLGLIIFFQTLTGVLFFAGLIKYEVPHGGGSEKKQEIYANKKAIELHKGRVNGHANQVTSVNLKTVSSPFGDPSGVINEQEVSSSNKKKWYRIVSDAISSTLENGFYWLGVKVGQNPKSTIAFSLLLAGTLSMGLLQRKDQRSGSAGFLSPDSEIIKQRIQFGMAFQDGWESEHYMLVVDDDNLLVEDSFRTMVEIDMSVKNLTNSNGKNFSLLCSRLAGECKERSLFEFWSYNASLLNQLSNEDILTRLKGNLTSPVFHDEVDITTILGGITTGSQDGIKTAKAHLMRYVTAKNEDDWQKKFIEVGRRKYNGLSVYVKARKSRTFETNSYKRELPLMFAGFGLIFIYIILMTGKFSLLEHRAYIALMGVFTAGLSMASGIGLASSIGFEWSVIHMVAPFLVIGIGVDDMFIIIQAWNTVDDDPSKEKLSLPEKTGHALKSAGVSITITSVTDLVAFAVGSTSELKAFSSFSVYVAVCIILLFFLQCTFFLACTVLDQRRREERYDACLACCYQHDESYKPSECSQRELSHKFFEDILGRLVQYLPVQIVVILITLGLTSFMAWGFKQLQVSFDPDWYIPDGSYVIDFHDQHAKYFSGGQEATVAVIGADFYAEREKLHLLHERLKQNENLNPKYLRSWFEDFSDWMRTDKNVTDLYSEDAFENQGQFYGAVWNFLQGKGRIFSSDVQFNLTGMIISSKFQISHKSVENEVENVDIIESVREDCDSIGFSNWAFPLHRSYFTFEIMRIIRKEVYRNLGITLLCVFIMVLPMIASIQMSFWVVLCVVFTIVDVAGSMYFAGLSIESSTIITLLMSVGLAVDYAAHVGHKFLTLKGSRKMRVRVTLGQIGPAVFNGGFSTFLALVLLAAADTYSYKVFFTVFACVVGYGLWNGLLFLPCVLSLVGPGPHETATEARLSQRHIKSKQRDRSELSTDEIQASNSSECI